MASVAFGMRVLFAYENAPGRVGALPTAWPATQIERTADHPTLVMFAHPHCPCTDASVGELARLMARLEGRVQAYVVFVRPKEAGGTWDDTDLRRNAEAIPGVEVIVDADGAEARRFGAETSGHTLLFGVDGRLLFSGGITASRGHAGENVGESAIVAIATNHTPARTQTRVFGCALIHPVETELTALCLK